MPPALAADEFIVTTIAETVLEFDAVADFDNGLAAVGE